MRPFLTTLAVAVGSVGLLVVAVALGWLGPDVDRGAEFCEAAAGTVRQPANAWSNLGFVVAGLAIAWQADRRRDVATAYACVVVLLGPASAAMHATESSLGGRLDQLSMYLVASFAAAYALTRTLGRGRLFLAQVFLLLVAACQLVGLYDGEVPVVLRAGNLVFGVLLVVAIVLEVRLRRADLRIGAAALGTMVLAFVVWNLGQHGWCDPASWLQAHAAWHLLGAVSAYLLYLFWVSEEA